MAVASPDHYGFLQNNHTTLHNYLPHNLNAMSKAGELEASQLHGLRPINEWLVPMTVNPGWFHPLQYFLESFQACLPLLHRVLIPAPATSCSCWAVPAVDCRCCLALHPQSPSPAPLPASRSLVTQCSEWLILSATEMARGFVSSCWCQPPSTHPGPIQFRQNMTACRGQM
jgi:hypothetical protein